ncbi:MAG: nucleotidyltransferase [Anaerolineales bacterium]|nr:nucleotidyltransferase [Anaerolineales bacterium]
MHTLGTHFGELLKNIQPPPERVEKAQDLPSKVRDYLKEHEDFTTLYPYSRLAGSYAQDLCVGDVKDVDFLVRVSGDPDKNDPEAKQLIQDLKKALDGLPEALGYKGEAEIDIERARRSVHVYFKGEDFHVDAVPCIAPNGFDEVLYVPDRGFNKWIKSHPIGYIKLLKDLNDEHHGKVRPLIKLLKHYRNYQMKNRRPKSYWLGALVIHHVRKENGLNTSLSLAELFRDLCNAIYCQYDHLTWINEKDKPNIPDPLLGHNISWNWSRTHFETFMRRLDDGRNWATKALESKERNEAISLWQKIFGEEYFPNQEEAEKAATRLAIEGFPGKSYVTNTGIIVSSQPSSGIYTPVKQTTFHGEA